MNVPPDSPATKKQHRYELEEVIEAMSSYSGLKPSILEI
jgi:hypothetical protein